MAEKEVINYLPAGPVANAFHLSHAFVRGLMGPVGSSKSSACCAEIFDRACRQTPDSKRVRPTRWGVFRNTYPELKSTTIKTWLEWFPMTMMSWDAPITGKLDFWLPDKTRVQAEVQFFALERPEDVDKISSLELTGAWMNEAREMAKKVLDKCTERVGRYPKLKRVPPSWRGVILDTNPPDDDHWYYALAEGSNAEMAEQTQAAERKLRELGYLKADQPLFQFFKQPGGLILTASGEYEPNPAAENIPHLDGGYAYYFRQLAGKDAEWIKSQVLGQYASIFDGKPVYEGWSDETYCRPVEAVDDVALTIGLDYGLSPAAAICQFLPDGRFHVLDEIVAEDTDAERFAIDLLKPFLSQKYPRHKYACVGDPAGMNRAQTNAKTVFETLAENGIIAAPAISNEPTRRIQAVKHYLSRLVIGKPAFALNPRAATLRKGFNGGYHYRRLQMGTGNFRSIPDKNRYSHPHDALQYAALFAQIGAAGSDWTSKVPYRTTEVV